ncbi:hypothetical protein GOBAR_AA01835 [Gossypium barbadense]|uniref:Uncharacterized protein n=1 Tax=Gossypium barbadense TaxID=3634 RepID=A0A2P5YT60_GOSBA|nr:hypothetical protein GOBAR_AA01835 [Gossypium barbadense]
MSLRSLLPRPCMKVHPRFRGTGVSHASVVLEGSPTAMSHDRSNLSLPVSGERWVARCRVVERGVGRCLAGRWPGARRDNQ